MKVTVLLVNYKNWQDTIECLESVLKSTYLDLEVVVVDNSPDETSIYNLEKWARGDLKVEQTLFPKIVFPEVPKPIHVNSISEKEYFLNNIKEKRKVSFIRAEENNGFAAANNIVLKKLCSLNRKEDFVFLLNNDTVILSDTIEKLINAYKRSNIGIAGCTLIEYSDPKLVQSVGGVYNDFFGTTSQVLEGITLSEFAKQDSPVKIDYPVGAAMFLSIDILLEIGLLDTSYFLYFEELDWVCRSKKHPTGYFPNCHVYHKGGVSIGSNQKSFISDKFSLINRINFAKKHNQKNLFTVYLGVFLAIFKRFLFFKFTRSFSLIREVIRNEN